LGDRPRGCSISDFRGQSHRNSSPCRRSWRRKLRKKEARSACAPSKTPSPPPRSGECPTYSKPNNLTRRRLSLPRGWGRIWRGRFADPNHQFGRPPVGTCSGYLGIAKERPHGLWLPQFHLSDTEVRVRAEPEAPSLLAGPCFGPNSQAVMLCSRSSGKHRYQSGTYVLGFGDILWWISITLHGPLPGAGLLALLSRRFG
jgi:hypothetical protein